VEKTLPALEALFPCWDEISDAQRRLLTERAEQRRFSKGAYPHRGGDDCAGLFLVRSGQLRAFILSQGGKEITLYRLFPRDICLFSAACIMRNISFEVQVEAEKDTDVFIVPAGVYESLVKVSLPVAEHTNRLMADRFSDVMWVMEQILFTSFDSRLSGFLIDQRAIEQSDELIITHDEIARHLGSAREVVTRMLNYFAAEGMVRLSRGRVTILDPQRLRALVQ
jgi:CRP/FNR family transcriptional regulator